VPHWQFWVLYHIGYYSGPWTNLWGGFISDLGLIGVIGVFATWYRKHNCHVKWCFRLHWRGVDGTSFVVCRHHHPENAPTHQDVLDAHKAAKETV
jgi:hypothetical protein